MNTETILGRGFVLFIALCLLTGTRALTPYQFDGIDTVGSLVWSADPCKGRTTLDSD